ncbi:MAG: hypothetical protein QM770_03795 [Tepidisphaeraceae bacterium]
MLPGKYRGIVFFDRWGGCTLYRGIYVAYVSESVKEQLRAESGKCVELDVTEIDQPMNPGDGLIKQFKLIGEVPSTQASPSHEGLAISIAPAFDNGKSPEFVICVKNVTDEPQALYMDDLAPTLLALRAKAGLVGLSASDGPQHAVVTRQPFWLHSNDEPRTNGASDLWRWTVLTPTKFAKDIPLEPNASFELRLAFTLPPNEYQFLAGFGGRYRYPQYVASNSISFDVKDDGTAVVVK